jgi:hypothetical protein
LFEGSSYRSSYIYISIDNFCESAAPPFDTALHVKVKVASFSDLYWKWVLGIKLLFFSLRHPRNKGLASTSLWRGYSQFRSKNSAVWKLFKKTAIQ